MEKITTWPEGSFLSRSTWHFHRRLLERYSLMLKPFEFEEIHDAILLQTLKPMILKKTKGRKLKLYCCVGYAGSTSPIYVLAHPEHGDIVSVYEQSWIKDYLKQEREQYERNSHL